MSMINDALRRASSVAKTVPGGPLPPAASNSPSTLVPPMPVGESAPPLPPPMPDGEISPPAIGQGFESNIPAPPLLRVEPTRKKSSLPIVLITLFVFCMAGAAAAYFWQKNRVVVNAVEKTTGREPGVIQDTTPTRGEIQAGKGSGGTNGAQLRPSVAVTPVAKPASTPAAIAPVAAPAPPTIAAAPAVPVKFPPLRLQSIFYRPANPSVIINGKTLFVTDEINGVKVADIQPANVTLVLSGQTNVLTLR